jgi:hypothetical protein
MQTAPVLRLAAALALVPLAVSAIYLTLRHGNYPVTGDLAMTELVTRDVGRYAVELGPFSRDGWHHPGPAMYVLLAIPYRLLGSTTSALDVGALAINGASVVGMAVIARRRGGLAPAVLTLVGCALVMRSLGPDEVRLPWNPYVTVLPYALLVFLTWAMTCRDRWALPLAVGVASFVAQTHIGYVVLAAPLLAFGAAWLVGSVLRQVREEGSTASLGRLVWPVLVALAVGTVMWMPPLVEEVTGDPGNLTRAWEWFRSGGPEAEPARGYLLGWRLVTSQYGVPPEWLFGERPLGIILEPGYLYDPMAPVLLMVVAGASYLLWRSRPAGSGRLVAVWLAASVAGVVATARTVGPVYEYRVGWVRVLGMVAGVITAWAGWSALVAWRPALERRVLLPASLAVLAVLAVVGSVAHVNAGRPHPRGSATLAALVPGVVDGLPGGDGPVLVDGAMSFDANVFASGLLLQLERRGVDARLLAGDRSAGEHRMDEGPPRRAWLVVATGGEIAEVEAGPRATLLAFDGDRSIEELRADVEAGVEVPETAAVAVILVERTDGDIGVGAGDAPAAAT